VSRPVVRPLVVAPCGPVADTPARRSRVQVALRRLEAGGISPILDESVGEKSGYLAGSDEVRLGALLGALESDSRVVWAARGGYGAMRLLPALERELKSPTSEKLFLGFSDLTALFPLLERRGFRCVHGPVLSQVADLVERGDAGFRALCSALRAQGSTTIIRFRSQVPAGGVSMQGRLLGGNLSICAALSGTPYAPDYHGAILFLEDVGEPAYRLDRCLTQLELAGVFEQLRGVLVGDLGARGAEASLALERLRGICASRSFPLLTGLPIGHGNRNACLGYGAMVKVKAGPPDKAGRALCILRESP
jgi:muramoyltetrapeptide carboxypeptidase